MTTVSVFNSESLHEARLLPLTFERHRVLKMLLLLAALVHLLEFLICNFFFATFATPYFTTAAPSADGFVTAYSIIRQYGFFALNLAVLDVVLAGNPVLYRSYIKGMAFVRLVQAGFAVYELSAGNILTWQFFPSFAWDLGIAVSFFMLCPKAELSYNENDEIAILEKNPLPFGIRVSRDNHYRLLQIVIGLLGLSQVAWFFLSTVFWRLGSWIIQVEHLQENLVMSREQGLMLLAFGVTDLITAARPVYYRRMILLLMLQQALGGLGAAIELAFGSIQVPQFLTVIAGQAAVIAVFYYYVYPRVPENR